MRNPCRLKLDNALYKLDHGILEFSFTLANSTDSVIYLDCQVPPRFALHGKNLILTLDRRSLDGDLIANPPPPPAKTRIVHPLDP